MNFLFNFSGIQPCYADIFYSRNENKITKKWHNYGKALFYQYKWDIRPETTKKFRINEIIRFSSSARGNSNSLIFI